MITNEIEINEREKIRVTIVEYKGREYINFRIYFLNSKSVWHPTRKGVTLNVELIDKVIELLKTASRELKKSKPEKSPEAYK